MERYAGRHDGDRFRLAIESLADNVVVGPVSTVEAGVYSHGIGIGREHQRKGYASDAILAVSSPMTVDEFEERHGYG